MNSENHRIAVIAGSTGLVGHELLQLLQNDSTYDKVYCLVRKSSNLKHPRVAELVIDFDRIPESLSEIKSVDDIYCCLGTTIKTVGGSKEAFRKVDHDYPLALAKWGESMNAKKMLVVSAMGADANSSIFYNKTKGEMENDISKLKIESITFFRPSLLIGDRKENRPGEKIGIAIAKALSFLFIGLLKNYKGIHVKKVAAAMLIASRKQSRGVEVILSGQMNE